MPRNRPKPSGAGLPGTASGNRTDLANTVPTGLPYGEAGALAQAQSTTPITPTATAPGMDMPAPAAPPVAPTGLSGVPAGSTPPAGAGGLMAAALATPPPDSPGLTAATTRPTEPVTAGLPIGAGAGPEALGVQSGPNPLAQTLRMLADRSGSSLLATLAANAEAGL